MNFQKIFFTGILLAFLHSYSQENVAGIDTVYVFDNQINRIKLFQNLIKIPQEDLQKSATNLSEVLRFQSLVYVKENGRGAVSSPSFRGTSAQHTAFVWNGININSAFLGQGDINNIGFLTSDELEIKSGGGSVIYGSGAISGSIHLNNLLDFNKGFKASFFSEAASFETYNNVLKLAFSNDKLSMKFSGSYLISQNDYEVTEEDYINRNGEYYNTNFNLAASYKIAPYQKISWISEFFNGMQHYPVFIENGNKTRYGTQNIRNLISWDLNKNNLSNSLKAAYTEENFQYYGVMNAPKTSGATGKNYILKNDFNYFFSKKLNANIITEFQNNKGEGYESGIGNVSRNTISAAGLLRYFANEKLSFEGGIKKDFVENVSSPFLFSLNTKWKVNSWYETGINVSRNFLLPSFNALYWYPGGNINLKSEISMQGDWRNYFKFSGFKISVTPYYIRIKNMIQWLPTSSGYWAVFNTDRVESYGLESQLEFEKKFEKNQIYSSLGYIYTKSTDLSTGNQRMYVPFHKFHGMLRYRYNFLEIYFQGMFNGLTYTSSDENRKTALDPYFVMNSGISATFMRKVKLGFKVNNIFDEIYETTYYYPLPKRNYSINLLINI